MEAKVEKTLYEETLVYLGQETLSELKEVFDGILAKQVDEPEHIGPDIDLNIFIASLVEDEYIQDLMENKTPVRIAMDGGQKEDLEDLLNRLLNTYQHSTITWVHFLGYFSKRGRLTIQISLSPAKLSKAKSFFPSGGNGGGAADEE